MNDALIKGELRAPAVSLAVHMFSASDLGPRLSEAAAIVVPGDATFADLTSRWREWHAPEIDAIVQVVTEKDVQETVGSMLIAHQHKVSKTKDMLRCIVD